MSAVVSADAGNLAAVAGSWESGACSHCIDVPGFCHACTYVYKGRYVEREAVFIFLNRKYRREGQETGMILCFEQSPDGGANTV